MNQPRRPWWLLVNRPAGLVTTIREESQGTERLLTVRGEPVVQGLAWLTWGPAAALLVVTILTGLAITLEVREQDNLTRMLFIGGFLGLPAFAWGIATVIFNKLSAKHVQAEILADTQECLIRLNQSQGEFTYRSSTSPDVTLQYAQIQRAKVAPAIGARDGKSFYLVLDTDHGPIILLNETLGTQPQKVDLAREIEDSLRNFAEK